MRPSPCRACGSEALVALPIPHPDRALISDGRCLPRSLDKVSCLSCGLVSHSQPLDRTAVRQFYAESYALGAATGTAERDRADGYADVIAHAIGDRRPSNVLEIGCGGGLVIERLAERWTDASFVGLEAAPALAQTSRPHHHRIEIVNGFLEEFEGRTHRFDLVHAINVLEHAQDPVQFLTALASHLTPSGVAVLICPAGGAPNLEMMFIDHIHTFTPQALDMLLAKSGLCLAAARVPPRPIGDFAVYVATRTDGGIDRDRPSGWMPADPAPLAERRGDYLARWATLESILLHRMRDHPIVGAFGAGEAAALIAAYAPKVWDRLEVLTVDQRHEPRSLGKPVVRYPPTGSMHMGALLLAVHPRNQNSLAARLLQDGVHAIVWNDHISS